MECKHCHECGSSDIVTDYSAGDVICTGCGIVIGDRIIDNSHEIHNYVNNYGAAPLGRVDVTKSHRPDSMSSSSLGTVLSRKTNSTQGGGASGEKRPALRASLGQNAEELQQRKDSKVMSWIEHIALKLHLSQQAVVKAQMFWIQFSRSGSKSHYFHNRNNMEKMGVAVLYLATRQIGQVRTIQEFATTSGVEKKVIGKYFKWMTREFEVDVAPVSLNACVDQYCNKLNLSRKTKDIAEKVANKAAALGLTSGKATPTAAAAIIYVVAALTNAKRSTSELAKLATCAEVSLRSFSKELNNNRFELFKGVSLA